MWDNGKYILVSVPSSWNPCNFLGDRSVFCSNEVTLGRLLDEGWSPERSSHNQRLGVFSPTPPSSREERGAGNGVNDWSCLHEEVSINILKVWGLESFQVGDHTEVWGEWCAWTGHGSLAPLLAHLAPYTCLPSGCLSVSFIISFYNKLVNSK